jgi:hypothetical protein
VRYYRGDRPVAGALVDGATSDGSGNFSLSAPLGANLMLAPTRGGGLGAAVTALDAAWALQVAAGLRSFDADQQRACDVSGNGTVSALDAAYILQQVVGSIAHAPVAQQCGSDFAFVPAPSAAANQRLIMPAADATSCQPGAVALEPLAGAASGQDFRAIAFGDCTGNWQPPAAQFSRASMAPAVRIGPARASRQRQLRVPIVGPAHAQALQLELRFDPTRLRFDRVRSVGARAGTLVQGVEVAPGVVRIAAASTSAASGRLVALLTLRAADASLADLQAGAVVVDEVPAHATVSR